MALTHRESSVLELIDAGMTQRAIAQHLGISHRTVRTIATTFSPGANGPRLYREVMAKSSAALLAAIKRERPE